MSIFLALALGRLKSAIAWLCASSSRLLVAALCMAILWGWAGHRSANKWKTQASKVQATLTQERAQAEEVKAKAEADYRSKAHAADISYESGLTDGGARLAAYVAAHRVQPAAAPHSPGPAQGGDPGIPAIPPAETVLAELSDLRTCNADYAYAKAAHDWAMGLR